MRFCLFGTYTVAAGYPVNRVLQVGLSRAGHDVDVCRVDAWGAFVHDAFRLGNPLHLLRLGWRLLRAWLGLWRRFRRFPSPDWIVVGYPGFLDVHLARFLGRGRPVALVSFISLYDTVVSDREKVAAGSWLARALYRLDRAAFRAADTVLVDTRAQGSYYAELFGVEPARFTRSYVGEDDADFVARADAPRAGGPLRVLFFGTYVPLHGVDTIVEAAHLLRADGDIHFTLIGKGQMYPDLRTHAEALGVDIEFIADWVGSEALVNHISTSHVCLGIFGTTAKAARVIPYKVFDAAAVGRAVVTRDSPAIRELFGDGASAMLCAPGDPSSLARTLRRLRDDDGLRMRVGAAGHQAYRERGCPQAVGRDLALALEERR